MIVDEADAVAPQKPQKGEERMLGAIEDIVRRGGQRGIGCILVTQRSAVLNKNVLTQAQMLIVLRTIAPQDIAAMKAWIDVHGTIDQGKELIASLPSLPIGDAWFWSPGWPTDKGIFQRSRVLPITTFDSGATPKPGEQKIVPKNLADVNLDALKKQMAATIEKAKADDPKLLKKRIAELEREREQERKHPLKIAVQDAGPMGVSQWMNYGAKYGYDKFFEDKLVKKAVTEVLKAREGTWRAEASRVNKELNKIAGNLQKIRGLIPDTMPLVEYTGMDAPTVYYPKMITHVVNDVSTDEPSNFGSEPRAFNRQDSFNENNELPLGEKKILIAVAQHPEGVSRDYITVMVGYRQSSRDTYIKRLSTKGLIESSNGLIRATKTGIEVLGNNYEQLPTGAALRDLLLKTLPQGESMILKVLIDQGPFIQVSRDDISTITGYKQSSRDTYIKRLITRKLIENAGPGMLRVSEDLF